jgi:hypothetical protein
MHVEQVLGDVPKAERCRCHEEKAAAGEAPGAEATSWMQRLFGK